MTDTGKHVDPDAPTGNPTRPEGLSTSFGAFKTTRIDDYHEVLTTGLIVPDANVLLNLYRYRPDARVDFIRILHALREQLWVPRQVAHEYWSNREKVVVEAQRTADDAVTSLKSVFAKVETEINAWSNRVSLKPGRLKTEKDRISSAFKSLQDKILELGAEHGLHDAVMTQTDPVLAELERILSNNIGPGLPSEDYAKAIQEGMRRNRDCIPPGYKDKGKSTGNPTGDYILWEQTLREAEARKVDVLFITNDTKEDWWRKDGGEVRGPRPELYEELRLRAGVKFYIMRPQTFLKHATTLLELTLSEETISQVQRVDSNPVEVESDLVRISPDSIGELMYDFLYYLSESGKHYTLKKSPSWIPFGNFELVSQSDRSAIFEIIGNRRTVGIGYFKVKLEIFRKASYFRDGQYILGFLLPEFPDREVETFLESNEVVAAWPNLPTFGNPERWTGTSLFRSQIL